MSEGVTLLIIISMLAAGIISVITVERKESSLLDVYDWKRLPVLVACDLLFIGSFCVVLFYLDMEKLINPEYVSAGWQIGLLVVVIAHLAFGVRRFWRIVYKKGAGRRLQQKEDREASKMQHGKKHEAYGQNPGSGFVAYMQYALIYMALALLVILAAELFLCSMLGNMDTEILVKLGADITWREIREQLLGALLVCSLTGFILATIRVGQETELSTRQRRRDKIDEVKRYLRQ